MYVYRRFFFLSIRRYSKKSKMMDKKATGAEKQKVLKKMASK